MSDLKVPHLLVEKMPKEEGLKMKSTIYAFQSRLFICENNKKNLKALDSYKTYFP